MIKDYIKPMQQLILLWYYSSSCETIQPNHTERTFLGKNQEADILIQETFQLMTLRLMWCQFLHHHTLITDREKKTLEKSVEITFSKTRTG